jgi:predicted TIM-barrel fold metal-dependent hydrolase
LGLIDLHAHLGTWPFPIPAEDPVAGLVKLFRDYGIQLAAVSSAKAICYDMEEGNHDVARALPQIRLLRGYVYTNPNYLRESCREMDRYLAQPGFVGVKIHPTYAACPLGSAPMSRLIEQVAARTTLLKIHTYSAADAKAARTEAERHPELNFILAHACAAATRDAADVAVEFPNVFLEFSCSLAERGRVEYAVETCGSKQIVFGSDMDLLDPAFTLGMFDGAHLSGEDRQAVMYGNAARLLGLE